MCQLKNFIKKNEDRALDWLFPSTYYLRIPAVVAPSIIPIGFHCGPTVPAVTFPAKREAIASPFKPPRAPPRKLARNSTYAQHLKVTPRRTQTMVTSESPYSPERLPVCVEGQFPIGENRVMFIKFCTRRCLNPYRGRFWVGTEHAGDIERSATHRILDV